MAINISKSIDAPGHPPQESQPVGFALTKSGTKNIPVMPINEAVVTRIEKALGERADLKEPGYLMTTLAKAVSERSSQRVHKVFVKGATPVFRFDRVFPAGGEAEYNALSALYSVDPLHVARPFQLNRDERGLVTGYDMEEVSGGTVYEYMEANGGSLDQDLADQIRLTLKAFHENGLAHGDVNPHNIMVSVTTDGRKVIKFIDPAGYGKIPPDELQQYIDFDRQSLIEWLPDSRKTQDTAA